MSIINFLFELLLLLSVTAHLVIADTTEELLHKAMSMANLTQQFDFPDTVKQTDIYPMSLLFSYIHASESERPKVVQEITELVTHLAYLDSKVEKIASILFGPENATSVLGFVRDLKVFDLADDCHCYDYTRYLFETHCGPLKVQGSIQGYKHLQSFANFCNLGDEKAAIKEAILAACPTNNLDSYVVDVQNPLATVLPVPLRGSPHLCERVSVQGLPRMKPQCLAKAYRVSALLSPFIPDEQHNKIRICLHQNASLGLCECQESDWRSLEKEFRSPVMSPYGRSFVDVMFTDEITGFITVSLDEVV